MNIWCLVDAKTKFAKLNEFIEINRNRFVQNTMEVGLNLAYPRL